ncbi:hypothetical protein [Fulvimarina endophytica]|nr:hypothetical protein [Fulvimarina endophytica]
MLLVSPPAAAQSWRASGTTAGYYVDGVANGMFLRCAGSSLTVNFTGFPARFADGAAYRVGVSVDGLARILDTRAHRVRGRTVLVHAGALGELRGLIEDLRKGKAAEISTPAGRYTLPLTGSGSALGALIAACTPQ